MMAHVGAQLGRVIERQKAKEQTEHYLEALHHARDNLEIRVADRTDELRKALHKQQQMANRQSALYQILHVVSEQLVTEAVAQAAKDSIVNSIGWKNTSIILVDENQQHWWTPAPARLAIHVHDTLFSVDDGIVGRVIREKKSANVPDVLQDSDYIIGQDNIRSEMTLPLMSENIVFGVLNVESEHPHAFDANDWRLAESLADTIGLALANAKLHETIADEHSQLQAIITASWDGILFINPEGKVVVINEAALNLLSLPGKIADWNGHSFVYILKHLRQKSKAVTREIISHIRKQQTDTTIVLEGECEIPPRIMNWLHIPVHAEQTFMGALFVLHDITDEKFIAKMREDLTHTMVHDLRNPLSSVIVGLNVLAPAIEGLEAYYQDVAKIAFNGTNKMLKLINAILDVSRLESGHMPLNKQLTDFAELVESTLELQMPLAREKNLRLINQVSNKIAPLWIDPDLIERILENLIGNAIKFTPAGGSVQVIADRNLHTPIVDEENEYLLILVRDTGTGIPIEIQNQLFQKFATGNQDERGSGLGLAFCRLAIEAHNGRIWVESEPNKGSTFYILLPLMAS